MTQACPPSNCYTPDCWAVVFATVAGHGVNTDGWTFRVRLAASGKAAVCNTAGAFVPTGVICEGELDDCQITTGPLEFNCEHTPATSYQIDVFDDCGHIVSTTPWFEIDKDAWECGSHIELGQLIECTDADSPLAQQILDVVPRLEGPRGPMGSPGKHGEIGPKGPAGADGKDGATGPQGDTGPEGPEGAIGQEGPQGDPGKDGAVGPQGIQGVEGPQGIEGPKGDVGPIGPQGVQGEQGPQGDIGPQGPQGIPGKDGSVGPQGEQGIQGIQGEQGLQGVKGDDGAVGPQGEPGAEGPQGPQGEQGLKGDTGAVGPQGDPGADGKQGAQGIPGIQGEQGIQGETGPAGADGADGKDGAQGVPGVQGEQGPAGPAGADGKDGEIGPQGPAGADGLPGATGPAGTPGVDGTDGIDGTDGVDGTNANIDVNNGNIGDSRPYAAGDIVLTDSHVSAPTGEGDIVPVVKADGSLFVELVEQCPTFTLTECCQPEAIYGNDVLGTPGEIPTVTSFTQTGAGQHGAHVFDIDAVPVNFTLTAPPASPGCVVVLQLSWLNQVEDTFGTDAGAGTSAVVTSSGTGLTNQSLISSDSHWVTGGQDTIFQNVYVFDAAAGAATVNVNFPNADPATNGFVDGSVMWVWHEICGITTADLGTPVVTSPSSLATVDNGNNPDPVYNWITETDPVDAGGCDALYMGYARHVGYDDSLPTNYNGPLPSSWAAPSTAAATEFTDNTSGTGQGFDLCQIGTTSGVIPAGSGPVTWTLGQNLQVQNLTQVPRVVVLPIANCDPMNGPGEGALINGAACNNNLAHPCTTGSDAAHTSTVSATSCIDAAPGNNICVELIVNGNVEATHQIDNTAGATVQSACSPLSASVTHGSVAAGGTAPTVTSFVRVTAKDYFGDENNQVSVSEVCTATRLDVL